jgi:hypoxanthine phosphoribosyltransferase
LVGGTSLILQGSSMVYISQDKIDTMVKDLIEQVQKSNLNFDYIVGIRNDGLKVSKSLAYFLDIPHLSLRISRYNGQKLRDKPIIWGNLPANSRCLIVDLLVDSGGTFKILREHFNLDNSKTATLFWKPGSFLPDFYVEEKPEGWLEFPKTKKIKLNIKPNTRYHRLTVISRKGNNCLVRCDCGTIKSIEVGKLGIIQSCGCNAHPKGNKARDFTGVGEISSRKFNTFIQSAKMRNLEFNLTKQYVWDIFLAQNKKCALSGVDLIFDGRITNASLDRIDNDLGYIMGNVQWVDKMVNSMKSDFNQTLFINMCQKISEHNT